MQPVPRRTVLASAAALGVTALASCRSDPQEETQKKIEEPDPNLNLTGMPIVKEKITLEMLTVRSSSTAEDWNDVRSMQEMENLSNIHVEWGLIPSEQGKERRNLALASGDYPGVLNRTGLSAVDLAKYGEQGTFMALNPLIEEYMPNLSAILEQNPDIRSGVTFPDGNIYSLPQIYDPDFESLIMQEKLWVRADWLSDFGMEAPETLEEFEAYLEEVKGRNPVSGSTAAIPLTDNSECNLIYEMLWGTFGVANKGRRAGSIDTDDNGAVRHWGASEGHREAMEFLSRLYDKGLIQADIFGQDSARFSSLGKDGVYGSVPGKSMVANFGKSVGENYVALPPLKKTSSDEVPSWHSVASPLSAIGGFVITDKSEHPIETARWMDHFYGDEGARLFFLGVEGESYEKTDDGGYDFTKEITDNPDGLTIDEALKPYVIYLGGGYPGIVLEDYFKGMENTPQAREGSAVVAPYRLEEVWPAFTFTSDEADEMVSLTTDIDKLTSESRAKFITGELSVDNWSEQLAQYDRIGLNRYVEIQQAAYDRYRG
ncbi:MAG TPA: extracellular solute-binding protein [Candidatus Avipropionibacterium avicola]|uniref:Extracellular solute-binding protein n=1 Tax=Candidatus Avipropionibacterium avicola TaxID=2840701 RepID=A0A9D1GYS4_9ACTN|nr:extracellular solute-binding protein [Candidatus Avipropionibacterium avicola]